MTKISLYNDDFYKNQITRSYSSAVAYADILFNYFQPDSVVDIGCGRGAWLKAFKEYGVKKLVGFDGNWNSQENMIEKEIIFYQCDLNSYVNYDGEKFDLAISLEVAEHLEPSSASYLVSSLIDMSDVVMFGAAIPGQGGTEHINERPQTYWANIFIEKNYFPFDIFRPYSWGKDNIEYWYQQNTYLYIKKDSDIYKKITSMNIYPINNIYFMNCIHPIQFNKTKDLLEKELEKEIYFTDSVKIMLHSLKKAIMRRIFKRLTTN